MKTWHLVVMTLALVLMSGLLLLGGVSVVATGALDRVDVEIDDVDTVFTDRKGKKIKLGPRAVLDPGGTIKDLKYGYIRAKLDVRVTNDNPFPIVAEDVDYKVYVNGKYAGKGTFPGKGEDPVELPAGEDFETEVKVKIKTRKVFRSSKALKAILEGGELKFKVKGEATGRAMNLPLTRTFSVEETREFP